ncbi:TetR/AcrR family transcriptional regulator [Actinomycetospora soli]|uniref:TetR/AcrR family transcriptional regulator n=1 Tax=Actinomycetospora soli TaxID=2893887 RepID=UPI001E313692|nr:TetR/AcrR family transcriptional regulator [Actinomycetospora soli]MCD2189980.1 TetR/AcrR family transcriptional regulator [Actinomycetospora soli]
MPTRTFQGASAEERVAERRARLLDAALDVVGERGVGEFTMTAVCRAAGLTERYFYESFPNREDLLAALFDATSDTALRLALQAAAGLPAHDLAARARAAIRATVTLLARDPRSARLYREAVGHPVLAARRQDTVATFAAFLTRLVVEARPHLSPDDLEVTTVLLTAGIVDAVGFWLDGRLAVDAEHLVTRCVHLVLAAADFREER